MSLTMSDNCSLQTEADMDTESMQKTWSQRVLVLLAAGLLSAGPLLAQTPVDENGKPVPALDESLDPGTEIDTGVDRADGADPADLFSAAELEQLVGRIALYPDDLLAVVLPASAYPLQIVQAARFLEQLEDDKSLKPDESWDPSITALLNYPEVVELMNDDLDWTYRLGEAVVLQQADVIAAIEAFRDRAYAAGNLKSDERQTVSNNDGVIEIEPVEEEVIYVPYYEPERVVVYQTEPVYHYYARPCPLYYYPYPYGYSFASGYFWGVTTAFTIGWHSRYLHVFHDSYFGHPYYGHHYFGHFYRRPSINIYNTYYVNDHVRRSPHYRRDGDFWRPRRHSGALPGHDRSRADYYRDTRRARSEDGYRDQRDGSRTRQIAAGNSRLANRNVGNAGNTGFRGETGNEARARPGSDERTVRLSRNRSGAETRNGDRANVAEARRQADTASGNDTPRFRPRQRTADTRPANDNDRAIRFRARDRAARPASPGGANEVVRSRPSQRSDRNADVVRSSRGNRTATVPSVRRERPSARPVTPSHMSRPSVTQPAARSAPPRMSAPRTSSSQPATVSRPAPSQPSRAAPAPRQSSSAEHSGRRDRSHQR
ncbi:MAG: DUF3300 domain-containing protein [Woeseiaceae bacterium]